MVASQNGWRANDRSVIASISIPGGSLAVRAGDIGVIFQHLATRFNNEVEALVWPGNWGYAERQIRGGVQLSNHASGTAIDLNAPKHPLGTDPAANYSPAQIAKIHEIVAFYEGIIRWGGDYVGRKDGMHFEINDGVTEAQVARIAAKINGAPAPAPTPAPPAPAPQPWLSLPPVRSRPRSFQAWYNAYPFRPALLPIIRPLADNFGPQSEAALKKVQARYGLVADGIDGPKTKKLLWDLGWRG